MEQMRLFIVDAFTNQSFKGNPAGVCILPKKPDDLWMQSIASELNQSETAFLYPDSHTFCLRWFTPTQEVELCGHATLATAHILFETKTCADKQIHFSTQSGILTAHLLDEATIMLDFPSETPLDTDIPQIILDSLNLSPVRITRNRMDILMQLSNDQEVRDYLPNYSAIQSLDARGLIISALSTSEEYDIVSRCFYPACGVNEDPVTGSAHCALAPYWCEILGKNELNAYQASSRGGSMRVKLQGERVMLYGTAVTFGEISVTVL